MPENDSVDGLVGAPIAADLATHRCSGRKRRRSANLARLHQSDAEAIITSLCKYCPVGNVHNKSDIISGLIHVLIRDFRQRPPRPLTELISIVELLSVLICNIPLFSRPVMHSSATRVFLAWHDADVALRDQNDPLRIAFGELIFLTGIRCIRVLSVDTPYVVIPLHQLTGIRKGTTGWTTPYFHVANDHAESDSLWQKSDPLEIKKMFHCLWMIHTFVDSEVFCDWITRHYLHRSEEIIILAQIGLLLNNIECSITLVSGKDSPTDTRFLFLISAIKLCQNEYRDALRSAVQIVMNNKGAQQSLCSISELFLGGAFQFVSGPDIMLECVRIIMACLSALNFPITTRIALCQYAWPTLRFEFQELLANHVTDNRLFEFEQFREQILHTEIVDVFLALHRAGKLHMKFGTDHIKQGGRILRGATRNLSITTEKDLEDHIVNSGNQFQLVGPVLFNLIMESITHDGTIIQANR